MFWLILNVTVFHTQTSRNWDCAGNSLYNKPAYASENKHLKQKYEATKKPSLIADNTSNLTSFLEDPSRYLWPGHCSLICICTCCPTCSLPGYWMEAALVWFTELMGSKWCWAAHIKEQPVVPWDRSHQCIRNAVTLLFRLGLWMLLQFKPVWAELYKLFLAACERVCCQAFNFRLVSTIFWKFVQRSVFILCQVGAAYRGDCTYCNCTSAVIFQLELQMSTDETSLPQFSVWTP